uniref:uncharacterized protein LOC118550263 isoform X2 n=1 Tax=Halichoerus grypus TaxID=9711 RepID=UPI001658FC58|nr:uncharacterized protein LOC118550263 isoform X2 [Halichoerus grypus]
MMSTLKPKHRPFCFSVKGHVKMLRLDIINSMVAAVFMIIVSVLALLPETTTFIVLGGDLVNSFITAVFLLIVAILAMQEMERRHLFYVGGTQCLTAAIVCILDGIMVTKKIRDKMRRMLGLEYENSSSLLLEPKKSGPTPAPGKAGTPGSSKPPVAAPAKAPTQAPTSAARRTSPQGSSNASSKTSTTPSSRASSRTGAAVPRPSR